MESEDGFFLAPYMPSNPLMAAAWIAHLRYCLGEEKIVTEFRKQTGNQWEPGETSMDRLVDGATGADKAFFIEFAKWVNANLWGEVN